ncbi:MAG: cob(I)yrinic acid a,c-diamide adenosyltransferase [Spirochaeta sp.]|nr:cob(I)yrinic acid a,c-diamide adenosyltransferase [Spirochaeta sp.]
MIEFDKVTTRGGDRGESGLYNGERRSKHDMLFEALGDVDELTAALGIVRFELGELHAGDSIFEAQQVLFKVGAQVATPVTDPLYKKIHIVETSDIDTLELHLKRLLDHTEIGRVFITPGEQRCSAYIDVARTVCRRAERSIVRCIRERRMSYLAESQNYLNRLSDYLFVLARASEQDKLS